MTRHLTAGVDGSPESRWAAAWAADEAVLRNLPLRIVHADDWPVSVAVPVDGFETQHRWSDEMLTEVTNNLRERHPGLEITTQRLSARPPAALAAEASEAELLVLGSRGLSRITGFLIGSVGLATIGATERPVVLVRAAEQPDDGPPPARIGPYRDLIVGVDVNQSCDALLAFAFDEAARRGCTLRAVYGWSLPPVLSPDPTLDQGVRREVAAEVGRALADLLMPWRQKFPSVDVVERALVGAPGEQLTYCTTDADLVVVGRRIRKSPLGAHIGPITHAVIHHSPAPVAVVAHD
ncbi:universal stress protein [Streptomyces sp. NBC_01619]|uniref:universal stress protein n=1 Tax=Streptomyces sp. NBC_01619 TaxID=2975901 RepID=UPI002259F9D3|nr:universal stress protein [Streptomyces sp. NBC_01619]MCX4510670.1 universal stress protein [Streptomyces sp. NBC_01619]